MAAALGWDSLVFDDLPGATQQNLKFLLRYRDPQWLEGVVLRGPAGIRSDSTRRLVALLGEPPNSALGGIRPHLVRRRSMRSQSSAKHVRDGPIRGRPMIVHPVDLVRCKDEDLQVVAVRATYTPI
jgi:hypothetical protein